MIYYKVNKHTPVEIKEVEVIKETKKTVTLKNGKTHKKDNGSKTLSSDNYYKSIVQAMMFGREYLEDKVKKAKDALDKANKDLNDFAFKYTSSSRGVIENKSPFLGPQDEINYIKGNPISKEYYKKLKEKIKSDDLSGVTYNPLIFKYACDYCFNINGINIELDSVLELDKVSGEGYFPTLCQKCINELSEEHKMTIKVRNTCNICGVSDIKVTNVDFNYNDKTLSQDVCTNCLIKMDKLGLKLDKEK